MKFLMLASMIASAFVPSSSHRCPNGHLGYPDGDACVNNNVPWCFMYDSCCSNCCSGHFFQDWTGDWLCGKAPWGTSTMNLAYSDCGATHGKVTGVSPNALT